MPCKTCIKYKYSFLITKEAKKSKVYKKLHIFIMVKKKGKEFYQESS